MPFLFIFNIYPLQLFFIDLVCIYACMQYLHFGSEGSLQQCDENATPYNSLPFKQLQFYSISSNNFIALLQRNYMAVQRSAKNCTISSHSLKGCASMVLNTLTANTCFILARVSRETKGSKWQLTPTTEAPARAILDRQIDRWIDRQTEDKDKQIDIQICR